MKLIWYKCLAPFSELCLCTYVRKSHKLGSLERVLVEQQANVGAR